jgi:hypothetical protein
MTKGHDRTYVTIQNEDDVETAPDEIKVYIDARYVSACEAVWRILKFPMSANFPAVQRLQLHLPDMQSVTFDPEAQSGMDLLDHDKIRKTTLTEFFVACQQHSTAESQLAVGLLYADFPSKFTWDQRSRTWNPRHVRFSTIGRVYFAVPSAGERYYFRMLLYVVTCPTSFEYLRTYEGVLYNTFQEACTARGLLETDDEWDICLNEAGFIQSGEQLHQLFVIILLRNNPADPLGLFDRHLHHLSDDCRHRLKNRFGNPNPTDEDVKSLTLQYIEILLHKAGKKLSDFSLPRPTKIIPDPRGSPSQNCG